MKYFNKLNGHQKVCLTLVLGGVLAVILAIISTYISSTGADIGAGLLFLLGQVSIFAGLVGIAVYTKRNWLRILIIVIVVASVYTQYSSWKRAEDHSNKLYCTEKVDNDEWIPEGDEFCRKYYIAN